MKKPAYWSRAEYQPAVTALTLNRCSAISVAFCLKTIAVLVVNKEYIMTDQKDQGKRKILPASSFLDFCFSFSPVVGSTTLPNLSADARTNFK